MLNALSVFLSGGSTTGQARAARSLERQGFAPAERFEWDGGELTACSNPRQLQTENCSYRSDREFACCVGPLWYRGQFGARALEALAKEVAATGSVDESELRGNFALFLKSGDHVWLLNDGLGFVRIHASADGCFFSTSWLAACAYMDSVDIDEASAIEYVLLGAAHSNQSVVRGVSLLPLGTAHDLKPRSTWQRFPHGFGSGAPDFGSINEAVETVADHLRKISVEVASAFPDRINAALSGGFDSRLIVAGLLDVGSRPHLFVYGSPGSADVAVARVVANAMGQALDVVDKSTIDRQFPAPDIEALEQSALFFDGLPSDGIHDPGADRETRLQQNAGGSIALNGGGGEIFRNFFHLPDRRFTAGEIVKVFYRGFSRGVFRRPRGLSDYQQRLAASILQILGLSTERNARLTRSQVELIYPLFRCHYWMSVNNSVSVRHGYYATPLVDPESIRLAQRVPLRWKNAGAFESRLMVALHEGIAALPSGYGFRFTDGPDHKARLTEWLNCARPVRMRPSINAVRRHLHHVRVAPAHLQQYRRLLPGEWWIDPLLDPQRLTDAGALGRALAVEVVLRRVL
ncbi:MAG: asparagine synthase [Rhodanobacteraceae bacterium]